VVGAVDSEHPVLGASRRPSWWIWLGAAVVALGVGVVVWLTLDDEAGPPTATFDGAEVTYTGPDPVLVGEDGSWTVRMVNETDQTLTWGVASLTEPNPTFEEYLAFIDNYDGTTRLPWADEFKEGPIYAGETIEHSATVSGTVTIDFLNPRSNTIHTSGFITVVEGDG
jgi:hypothetical protein